MSSHDELLRQRMIEAMEGVADRHDPAMGSTLAEINEATEALRDDLFDTIIALVRADERKRIREAIEEKFNPYDGLHEAVEENIGNYDDVAYAVADNAGKSLDAALAAIGLTEKEGADHA